MQWGRVKDLTKNHLEGEQSLRKLKPRYIYTFAENIKFGQSICEKQEVLRLIPLCYKIGCGSSYYFFVER